MIWSEYNEHKIFENNPYKKNYKKIKIWGKILNIYLHNNIMQHFLKS